MFFFFLWGLSPEVKISKQAEGTYWEHGGWSRNPYRDPIREQQPSEFGDTLGGNVRLGDYRERPRRYAPWGPPVRLDYSKRIGEESDRPWKHSKTHETSGNHPLKQFRFKDRMSKRRAGGGWASQAGGLKWQRGASFRPVALPRSAMPWTRRRGGMGRMRRRTPFQGARARTGGFTGIERKFYDTHLDDATLTAPTDASGGEHNPSAAICLNSITQGDGEEQRDGRKCTVQSVFVKGIVNCAIQQNASSGDDGTKIYIALVLDTQTNGALLNSEDVFKNESGVGKLAGSPMRNMQFTQRFRILDTAELTLQNPNISWDGTNIEQQGLVEPFQLSSNVSFNTLYSGTTEDIANITDNSLSIIAYCSSISLIPKLFYNARVRFVG